ncbi:Blight resistance protein RGA1-like protein [Zea mays]|uniref:Blight resistance protein RGA1-like protein n=1 Tax=Zea mays TaxID=4577 RepID=A0A1D6QKX7_MAIZE|nr:Blight resistance protein RGA1-like protein [Zea mays]
MASGGVVASLLSSATKLLDLLRGAPSVSRRAGQQQPVSADVHRLQRLLRRIQATIDDAGEREIRDSSVKLWIAEITVVARDAEDVLEDYRYELIRRRVQRLEGTGGGASTSCKRKHHHDDQGYGIREILLPRGRDKRNCILTLTCFQRMIRKITRRFSISTDRAGFQFRPEGDDGSTSEGIVDITRWFEEIHTDQTAAQLRPEDEDGDISKRIGEIIRRFEEITGDRAALHLGQEDGERNTWSGRDSTWESRVTSHLLDESCVFGRTKEKEHVVKLVKSYSKCPGIHVLPIVGMGGIGKTTVAQMVYREVQESYDLLSWVHVPETFDLRKLAIAITESLSRQPCTYNNFSVVHDVLQQTVLNKRVFLVLDDLWNERQICWQDFLCSLKFADTMTILVTTRSKEVAQLLQTIPHFELGLLPEDHCWQLFQCYAFGHRNIHEESALVQVGRKIMEKCSCLPLAIKSIGCLLRSKMDMQTWMEISDSEFWEYSDNNEEILSALRLSFHRLPGRLKPCFLLCALYPKGEPFTKDDMIHLWTAHGYVQPSGCKTLEKVAGEYFDELNERSLIEMDTYYLVSREGHNYLKKSRVRSPVEISSGEIFDTDVSFYELHIRSLVENFHKGTTESSLPFQLFRLHDMIWDLAKSLSSCLFSAVAVDEGNLYMQNEVQHLFLWLGRGRSKQNTQRGHSELIPISKSRDLFISWINNSLGLESEPFRWRHRSTPRPSHRPQVSDFELLGLSSTALLGIALEAMIQARPDPVQDPMSSARLLAYLPENKHEYILSTQSRRSQLFKIDYLRTLILKQCTFYNIGIYTYLRALILYSCKDSGCIAAIQYLKLLRYLNIRNCDSLTGKNLNHLTQSICHLYSLEKLIVSTCWKEFSIQSCHLFSLRYLQLSVQFNDWSQHPLCHFHNLDTLCLQNCHSIAELPTGIGNLMNLRCLKLIGISEIKKLNHDSLLCQCNNNKCQLMKAIFPALMELELDSLCELQDWCKFQDSDCPKMQSITVRNCNKLRRIPYFGSVRSLMIINSALIGLQLSASNEPSQLQTLDISYCENLESLLGLENLCSLGSLYIAHCPKLFVLRQEKLLFRPQNILIDDCPGLIEWCDEQELYYHVRSYALLFFLF